MDEKIMKEIIDKINNMSCEEAEKIIKNALDETGIKYTYGDEGIVFNGLIQD